MKRFIWLFTLLFLFGESWAGKGYALRYGVDGDAVRWHDNNIPLIYGIARMPEEHEIRVRKVISEFSYETGIPFQYEGRHPYDSKEGDGKNTISVDPMINKDTGGIAKPRWNPLTGEIEESDLSLSDQAFADDELLKTVVYHELCHMLGLDHYESDESLMSSSIDVGYIDKGTADGLKSLYPHYWAKGKWKNSKTWVSSFFRLDSVRLGGLAGLQDREVYQKGASWRCDSRPVSFYSVFSRKHDKKQLWIDIGVEKQFTLGDEWIMPYISAGAGVRTHRMEKGYDDEGNYIEMKIYRRKFWSASMGLKIRAISYFGFFFETRRNHFFNQESGFQEDSRLENIQKNELTHHLGIVVY